MLHKEKVNTQTDEDVALLMTEVCELVENTEVTGDQVIPHKEKVTPKMTGSRNKSWYLDTGASNHMTSCVEKYVKLDRKIKSSV